LNNRTVVGTGAGVSIGDRFGSNLLFLSENNISDNNDMSFLPNNLQNSVTELTPDFLCFEEH
jgi:hypothetical protein